MRRLLMRRDVGARKYSVLKFYFVKSPCDEVISFKDSLFRFSRRSVCFFLKTVRQNAEKVHFAKCFVLVKVRE